MARSLSTATGGRCCPTNRCLALLALSALFFVTIVTAIPVSAPNAIHDKWYQLLQADRYSLVRLPPRLFHGDPFQPSQPHIHRNSVPSNNSFTKVPPVRVTTLAPDLRRNITSRVRYEGPSAESKFVCEVVNAPDRLDVKTAVAIALTTMSQSWSSRVTVTMIVRFDNLGNESILASGGGAFFVQLGSPLPDGIIIPIGAAEAIRGEDLNGNKEGDEQYDVIVTINSVTPWYTGDGIPPENQYDLATVLLHEIYHNLVFSGSVVAEKDTVDGVVQQKAYLFGNYRTRFDMFLATQSNCGVLQYLTADSLAAETGKSTGQLLAEAVCSNLLFFAANGEIVAQLHAPNIFQYRSSIYHFHQKEAGEILMFPSISRGKEFREVGEKTQQIQRICLDPNVAVPSTSCTLTVPTQTPDEAGGPYVHNNNTQPNTDVIEVGGPRVTGLPVWGFVLLIILAVILLILLLLLCLLLCLRRKRRRTERLSEHRSSRYSSYLSGGKGGMTKSSSRKESSAGRRSDSWGKWSKHSRSSRHSRHSHHSRHSKDSSRKPESERFPSKSGEKCCPSTGQNILICCCECCKPPLTRPPPIASVHQWEPDSVVSVDKEERCKKKKKHCRHRHDHHHGVQKVVKKVCKSKTVCPPNASTSRNCAKTTKCTTTVTKKPCRRVSSSSRRDSHGAGCSTDVERVRCKPPSTAVADHCVQMTPCVPVAPVCVPTTPVCVPAAQACRPTTRTCTPTTYTTKKCTTTTNPCTPTRSRSQKNCTQTTRTCTPTTTTRTCKTCKKSRNNCCCKVEVNVKYRC